MQNKPTTITDLLPTVQEAIARTRTMTRRQRGYNGAVNLRNALVSDLRLLAGFDHVQHNEFIDWMDSNHPGWRGHSNPVATRDLSMFWKRS